MSNKAITAIVVIALLGGIAGLHYLTDRDPAQLAARGVGSGGGCGHDHGEHDESCAPPEVTLEDLMLPIGAEGAEVVVQTIFNDATLVEDLLRSMFHGMERDYHGHVRFEFIRYDSDEGQHLMDTVTSGRSMALVINDEMIKMVPDAPFGMLSFSGSPVFEDWSERDLRMAIEWDLKQAGVDVESIERSTESASAPHVETGHVHGPDCDH